MTKFISFIKKISISIVAIILFFLAAEVICIVFLPPPVVFKFPQPRHQMDPDLSWKMIPNQSSFTLSAKVRTNSMGLRDDEIPIKKEQNEYRILCLGDSITFGNGVESTDTYPKVLEKMLNSSSKQRKITVINAGVQGYFTWQEASFLEMYGLSLQPDIVVIGFVWNDIAPRPSELKPKKIEKPDYFRVIYLLKRSRFLLFLREELKRVHLRIRPSSEYEIKLALLKGSNHHHLEKGWKGIAEEMKKIYDLKIKNDFEVVVIIFPLHEQLFQDYPQTKYQSRVKEIASKYSFDIIDLLPAFEKNYQRFSSLFIEWDGHLNERGHLITAQEACKLINSKMQSN